MAPITARAFSSLGLSEAAHHTGVCLAIGGRYNGVLDASGAVLC